MRGAVLALSLLLGACSAHDGRKFDETRSPVWRLTGLADPESVALDPTRKVLYVANVNGEGEVHDGNGFISRVSPGGKLLQREWVRGLDAPKGAAVDGDTLYVSDIDKLVAIDIPSGQVAARYAAPGAKFLNDVAVGPDGAVLVADSATARIFALKDGRLSVWSADAELKSVNGLLAEPRRLVVTTMEGKLLAMDYPSRTVKVLATGLGQADGVTPADGDNYFVSEWPGRLFRVTPDGRSSVLMDSRKDGIYLNDFIRAGDLLIVPNWKPGSLSAYRLMTWMLTDARDDRVPAQPERAWI